MFKEPTAKSDVQHCGTCGAVLGEYYDTSTLAKHRQRDCIKYLVKKLAELDKTVKSLKSFHCPNCGENSDFLDAAQYLVSSRSMRIPLVTATKREALPFAVADR